MVIYDMLHSKDYWTLPLVRTVVLVFLTLFHVQNICCGITDQIDKQFNTYSFIVPKIVHAKHKREIESTKTNPNGSEHIHGITVKFFDKGKEYIIDLSLNKELIPVGYFEKHQKNGAYVINKPNSDELEFCYYNGKVKNIPNSWAAISTCDGIRGMFFDGSSYHYIENVECDLGNKCHILYRHDDLNTNHTCGFPNTPSEHMPNKIKHERRTKRSLQGPYNQNEKSRFIELVLVVDNEDYKSFNSELPKVYQHTKDIANIINSLFISLNIFVTLVGVVVWTERDSISIVANGDTTLTNFLHYRREYLVKDHPNDNAQLLTKLRFDGGIVGKALKGPICTYEFSGGVNSDHSFVKGVVATTIAHEIGHNLGMEHDTNDCECPDDRCIMAPSSGQLSPKHWSSCSMEYLALAFEHGMDYCLRNKPKRLFGSPVCGNNFVEEGEQCDCGIKELCNNPCCNSETCKLFENATCATGQCCDLKTCNLMPAGLECRSALHECDLPEYCTGESEYCPVNVFKIDGSTCEKKKAFCYEGSCRTHEDQCRLLWGPTGESSLQQCYSFNNQGTITGNCGYNRLNKTYTKCNGENFQCGMLHCDHKNERLEFGMENVSTLSQKFINNNGSLAACRTVIVDLGLNEVDPGLTPDGAKCGENKMCINQKCISISDLRAQNKTCPYDCHGHGICNSMGNCHCNIGYSPPNCDNPGPGGSIDSGPASSPYNKGFITGMYVLTIGSIPLLLAVLLFAYCSKNHHSTTNWTKSNRKMLSNDAEIGNKFNGTVSPSSTLLIDNHKPMVLHKELLGNHKGFSIKPLAAKEQPVASRTPIRPAPSAPPVAITMSNENVTRSERLEIGQPVLDATTSLAVHELMSVPLKPAPPVPTTARPASTIPVDSKNTGCVSGGVGGYPTLRRITSFMKNQKLEEKKPATARANAKFDKDVLKNLEISQPILQNEINVPSEPLPLEADQHKAVVLRAQSLRTANNTKYRPSVPNFGSMRSKRPTSVVVITPAASTSTCSRPTSPPPQPPPPPQSTSIHQGGYQVPRQQSSEAMDRSPTRRPMAADDDDNNTAATRHENIYSVIDESPAAVLRVAEDECAYKVPKSLESSLLGEIVSAIQERNHESIYTSKPATVDWPQQTYENVKPTPTAVAYKQSAEVKLRTIPYGRPDLVQNCDENRSMNCSPDVLDAKQPAAVNVSFSKPVVPTKPTVTTATVGLKKKLSDSRPPSKAVADVHKRYLNGGGGLKKNPLVAPKPSVTSNR